MGTGELRNHLSEKQHPLAAGFEEHDAQIRPKDLKRDAREACSGTYVKKGEGLVGGKQRQYGEGVEQVPGHEARKIARSHEIDAPTPRADGIEMEEQIAKLRIGHVEAKRLAPGANRRGIGKCQFFKRMA